MTSNSPKRCWRPRLKFLAVVLALAALLGAARYLHLQALLRPALEWISHLGVWGPVVFVLIYVMACVLLVPGSLLTLGAGVVFGLVRGTIIVAIGATLGATAAFLVGRYLARDFVARKIAGDARFKAIDDVVAREGWKIVLLARLSPAFPFNLLNYAFGVTQVSLRDYFFASLAGMLPGTILFVYLGQLAGDLASLGQTERNRTSAEWALYGAGLLATVLLTVCLTRIAKKALNKRMTA